MAGNEKRIGRDCLNRGGSKGGARDARARGPNSFNFMQFFGKFGKSYVGAPRVLAPPHQGNPGSATDMTRLFLNFLERVGSFVKYNSDGST